MCLVVFASFGCTGSVSLHVETNFPDSGAHRTLALQTVYLLKESITSPEMEEAFKKYMASTAPPFQPSIRLEEKQIRTRAGFMVSDGRKIWERYLVEKVETNFEGKAKFRKLSPGDYWVYSIYRRHTGEWIMWNVKTTVQFYENTEIKLNNSNLLN